MRGNSKLKEVLQNHLLKSSSGWSMGSFGALAEFMQDDAEVMVVNNMAQLTRASERGAIRLDIDYIARAVAYETTLKDKTRWTNGFALCIDKNKSQMGDRNVLTELGTDQQAIQSKDADSVLFDIGLGAIGSGCAHLDFCIRTNNSELIKLLRNNAGKAINSASSSAMSAILKFHPHRIAITPIGRIEVYQKIGGPDTGGKSPEGPHTHLLTKLIKSNRSYSANIPIPDGFVPCAYLHPANPVHLSTNGENAFNKVIFDEFQDLLEGWGDTGFLQTKRHVWKQLKSQSKINLKVTENTRVMRKAIEVAIRQSMWLSKSRYLL